MEIHVNAICSPPSEENCSPASVSEACAPTIVIPNDNVSIHEAMSVMMRTERLIGLRSRISLNTNNLPLTASNNVKATHIH